MSQKTKALLIVILVPGISLLHYLTDHSQHHYHVFIGELNFLPIVLAGFWFGLRGALATSFGVTACHIPFVYWHWQCFSPVDFDRMLSLALYISLAAFIGVLKDRETVAHERLLKDKSLFAMARSLAAVAHDMKTPLIAIGGLAQRLQKKFNNDDPDRKKLDMIIRETERLEKMMQNMLDCGIGISLDYRAKVFDPFFTCKKEGTGLGLAIVKKIVEAHDGSMEILDNSPHGTIFRVMVPR